MVFMPPRHAKSETISKYFTSWFLGTYPDKKVILTSYEADFAATWGARSRNVLEDHHHDFGVELDNTSSARNRWDTSQGGGMTTAGVAGPITGKGGDIIIIDDPVKSFEQANSPTYRDKVWDWYDSTLYTRREPGASIILIMTRWHEDDLAGRLLDSSSDPWVVVSLPAIAEEEDPIGRQPGEALWPERYPIDELHRIKRQIGEYWFSALYQQQPQPSEGGLLKRDWLHYYDHPLPTESDHFHVYQGWDLAISEKDSADYTVCTTIGYDTIKRLFYVLDWYRDQIDFPTQVKKVLELYHKFKPVVVGIEDVAYQRALPQAVLDKQLLPIRQVGRVRDKVTRIISRFTYFEQGRVLLPEGHECLGDFEREYVYFPQGRYDDMLDSLELALGLVRLDGGGYATLDKRYVGMEL
jgi:predicted phage terminase large subunit-like protein